MNTLSLIYHATLSHPPPRTPSPMERLPQDILVLILQSISSLRSLRAAVLASSAMNSAFRTAKIETLARVVSRSRPTGVHTDAVALSVLMHLHRGPPSKTAEELLDCNLQHPRQEWLSMPRSLSSLDVLHFHWYVEYFTERLFKSSMRYAHQKRWTGSEKLKFRRLSQIETIRIQRALYRLEFFSLYAELEPTRSENLMTSPYWRKHVSVWEMEELACIQNLIFHRLAAVDTVIHSLLEYMGLQPSRQNTVRNKERARMIPRKVKALLMCNPLSTLFRVLTEPQKQSTRRIIQQTIRKVVTPTSNPSHTRFLDHDSASAPIPHPMFRGLETQTPATLPLVHLLHWEESPLHPSYGYARAYRTPTLQLVKLGHMSRKQSSLYNEMMHHEDRKWGYCLWDEERMEFWGEEFAALRTRARIRITGSGLPGWTTVRIN